MKKLYLILAMALILCFMVDCQNKAEKAELEQFRAQAKLEEQNKALAIREGEMLNKRDFDGLAELLAPEFLLYKPRSTKPASREEQINWLKIFHKAFPDLSWNPQEFIAAGDKVIVRFNASGTHKGEYKGIPATGNKIEFNGIVILRMENGKIVEQREQNDMSDIVMQISMELKPKEWRDKTQTESAEQELLRLENEWAEAWVKSDVAFYDRITADDYTWTSPWGWVATKASDLALLRSGDDVVTSWVLADMKVRVYGDAAVITGRDMIKETYKGKDVSGQERWTHTWVKLAGRWQCVAGHSSEIAQK